MQALRPRTLTQWLLRLFGYDGALPAIIYLIPRLMVLLMVPSWLIEITAVIVPIVAYLWRAALGLQQIEHSFCSKFVQQLQKVALVVGLIALLLVDAFMILASQLPRNALSPRDYQTAFLIYVFYLALMAAATYPGNDRNSTSLNNSHNPAVSGS